MIFTLFLKYQRSESVFCGNFSGWDIEFGIFGLGNGIKRSEGKIFIENQEFS